MARCSSAFPAQNCRNSSLPMGSFSQILSYVSCTVGIERKTKASAMNLRNLRVKASEQLRSTWTPHKHTLAKTKKLTLVFKMHRYGVMRKLQKFLPFLTPSFSFTCKIQELRWNSREHKESPSDTASSDSNENKRPQLRALSNRFYAILSAENLRDTHFLVLLNIQCWLRYSLVP